VQKGHVLYPLATSFAQDISDIACTHKKMKLADYVKRRNGVPLGASGSLRNMMIRSLGAGNFSTFWKYWNSIWGCCLGKFIIKPLKKIIPASLSLILTFAFCGFLYDVVIMIVREGFTLIFTPWFLIMGLWVVVSELIVMDYSKYSWINRAFIFMVINGSSLVLAYKIRV